MGPHVKVSVLCPGWVNTRIAESARNRPEHLQDQTPTTDDADGASLLQAMIEKGMPPEDVAGKVLDAIRAEQFWVLTHDDEADFWVDSVNRRMRSLEARANPQMGLPI
jgi:short-subunit dehydrogenase